MSVEKRGKRWRVRYLDTAGAHRSKTFDLREHAQDFDTEVRRRKQRGTLATLVAKPVTLDSYVADTWAPVHAGMLSPASRRAYAWAYDTYIGPALGKMPLHTITPAIIARWQARMVAQAHGHETVRRARVSLSGILRTAVETEVIATNPVTAVRAPKAPLRDEVRPFSPARIEAIRAVCDPFDAALVSVLAYSGLRPQEARGLRWGHVLDRTLVVGAPKTRKRRSVRLLDPIAQDLREWRMQSGRPADEEPVFTRDGHAMTDQEYGNWRRGPWRDALHTAGEDYQRPYTCRHTFASLLLHEGRSAIYVARQLGHSATETNETYGHVIEELEDAPRISAEDAIRAARASKVARQLPNGTHR